MCNVGAFQGPRISLSTLDGMISGQIFTCFDPANPPHRPLLPELLLGAMQSALCSSAAARSCFP